MSDDELRALERAVSDAPSRIRYADALVRIGRAEEALRVLLAGLHDPEVRANAGRFVPRRTPIVKKPRLLWTYRETKDDLDGLDANAFLVVASVHAIADGDRVGHEVHVLDPATGSRRTGLSGHTCAGIVDEVVVAVPAEDFDGTRGDGSAVGFDGRNGGILWRLDERAPRTRVDVIGRQLVRQTTAWRAIGEEVEVFSLDDPRRPPVRSESPATIPSDPSFLPMVEDWAYSMDAGHVLAEQRGEEMWRVDVRGLDPRADGLIVLRGATLLVGLLRGGSVFCLG